MEAGVGPGLASGVGPVVVLPGAVRVVELEEAGEVGSVATAVLGSGSGPAEVVAGVLAEVVACDVVVVLAGWLVSGRAAVVVVLGGGRVGRVVVLELACGVDVVDEELVVVLAEVVVVVVVVAVDEGGLEVVVLAAELVEVVDEPAGPVDVVEELAVVVVVAKVVVEEAEEALVSVEARWPDPARGSHTRAAEIAQVGPRAPRTALLAHRALAPRPAVCDGKLTALPRP